MAIRYILSEYVGQAMAQAVYDKLEDNTFAGRIPECKGVIAFGATLHECENELRSTLEDWILLGLKLGHPLPVIGSIALNQEPTREPLMNGMNCEDLSCKIAEDPRHIAGDWRRESSMFAYNTYLSGITSTAQSGEY